MILVTLGTQKQSFTRLLDYIEKSKIKDTVVVQAGHTKYNSEKMKILSFIEYDEMENLIDKADIIITHGGTGSIIMPLMKGKIVIACARLRKYGEHVDDHQQQIVDVFSEEGYILKLDEDSNIDELMKKLKSFKQKKYRSNTKNFINKLENAIVTDKKTNKFLNFLSIYIYI